MQGVSCLNCVDIVPSPIGNSALHEPENPVDQEDYNDNARRASQSNDDEDVIIDVVNADGQNYTSTSGEAVELVTSPRSHSSLAFREWLIT